MGVLNLTPDSRYGSHYYQQVERALVRAEEMLKEGAAIIDIGGESTRPGATPVALQEELDRVMPVLEGLRQRAPRAIISIDTRKAEVMRAAIAAGADMINDVTALQDSKALEVVANSKVAVCLMHMQGEPQTMQVNPRYENVVAEIKIFLYQRFQECMAAGIAQERITIDPGFGFGKTLQHNLQLLNNLTEFTTFGAPLLVGLSRKIMLQQLLDLPVEERLYASIALATLATTKGARILRTHDVKPTVQAVKTTLAVLSSPDLE